MLESINLFRQNVGSITLPVLIMHGADDHLVPPSSAQFTYDNCSSQDKRLEVISICILYTMSCITIIFNMYMYILCYVHVADTHYCSYCTCVDV